MVSDNSTAHLLAQLIQHLHFLYVRHHFPFLYTLKLFIYMAVTLPRHNASTWARIGFKKCGKYICNTFRFAQYLEEVATRWDRCKDVASCVLLGAYTKANINECGTHTATQFFCEYMKPWCVKVQMKKVCCTPVFFTVMKHIGTFPLCSEMTL